MSLATTVSMAAEPLTAVVRAIRDDQLTEPTPCDDYDVGALVAHLLHWGPTLVGAAHKHDVAPPDVPLDLPLGWHGDLLSQVDALATAWSEPAAWEGTTRLGAPTELPAATVGGMAVGELVVHGWDLGRAVGHDPSWPDALLEDLLAAVVATAPMGRQMGVYGPEVPVAPDAPLLDRVLGATGRDPAWMP